MPLPTQLGKGGCGAKALQFMAMGIPTVCSPVGVNTDIIQDNENGLIRKLGRRMGGKVDLLVRYANLERDLVRRAANY
jgi:glycosyltransferase involved in cell wall biosynthesis